MPICVPPEVCDKLPITTVYVSPATTVPSIVNVIVGVPPPETAEKLLTFEPVIVASAHTHALLILELNVTITDVRLEETLIAPDAGVVELIRKPAYEAGIIIKRKIIMYNRLFCIIKQF